MPGYQLQIQTRGPLRQFEEIISQFEPKEASLYFDEAIVPSLLQIGIENNNADLLLDLIQYDDDILYMSNKQNQNIFHFMEDFIDKAISDGIIDSKLPTSLLAYQITTTTITTSIFLT